MHQEMFCDRVKRSREAHGYEYDYTVFIGRFRFFHKGHLAVVRRALELGNKLVLIVGSCRQARSVRNPLFFAEVEYMIRGALTPEENPRVIIRPQVDHYNDVAWVKDVQATVADVAAYGPVGTPRIALVGHSKDHSSYYLRMFPGWASEDVSDDTGISATPIREAYFISSGDALYVWASALPPNVVTFLREFAKSETYAYLAEEYRFLREYRETHPDTMVTAEAVVLYAGHVLLTERRNMPGRRLFALPGGFVKTHERIRATMIRELLDENRLQVPKELVEGATNAERTFDSPYRSARGRIISTAFLVQLTPHESGFPAVAAGNDAVRAMWVPISELQPERMFEDHYHIIDTMLSYAD